MIIIGPYERVQLPNPKIIGRYSCQYCLEVPNERNRIKVYFTNITSWFEVDEGNFVSVYADWDQHLVVLAPDLLHTDRASYLINFDYPDSQGLIGVRQRILFGCFFHDDRAKHRELIALGRFFPELYDQNDGTLMTLYFESSETPEDQLVRVTFKTSTTSDGIVTTSILTDYVEGVESNATDFVMRYRETEELMHPRTRFIIGDDNIIFVPKDKAVSDIENFLNLQTLPSKASIIWTDDLTATIDDFLSNEESKMGLIKSKIIMIGFDVREMGEVRSRLRPHYNK